MAALSYLWASVRFLSGACRFGREVGHAQSRVIITCLACAEVCTASCGAYGRVIIESRVCMTGQTYEIRECHFFWMVRREKGSEGIL